MAKFSIDSEMRRARACERNGAPQEARDIYLSILQKFPNNSRVRDALSALGSTSTSAGAPAPSQERLNELVGLYQKGEFARVAAEAERLARDFPAAFALWNILGAANLELRRFDAAELAFGKAIEGNPNLPQAHFGRGFALANQGRGQEAIASYRQALKIKPDHAEAHYNLGIALMGLGRLDEAIASYRRALQAKPDYGEALVNLGNACKDKGNQGEAVEHYRKALVVMPGQVGIYRNLGNALRALGRHDEAIETYWQALRVKPDDFDIRLGLGLAFRDKDDIAGAVECFRRAVGIRPDNAEAHNNLGSALKEQGSIEDARNSYEQALRIRPDYADAYYNIGILFRDLGELEAAADYFQRAITARPDYAEAFNSLGLAQNQLGQRDEAIDSFRKALEIKPDFPAALAQKLYQQAHLCDWTAFDEFEGVKDRLGIEGDAVEPFCMLAFEDDSEHQARRARRYASHLFRQQSLPLAARPRQASDKIRLGYFSADFHDHPMLYLMAGLFREHDKSRFEIFAYSFGPQRSSAIRDRVLKDIDHFIEIGDMPDQAVVDLARGHGLDIAIDRKGYTRDARSRLFSYRLAPIQINYLAYPATMGADFIDYIIADPMIIPPEERQFYTEKILYLPHSYQPNDNRREIAGTQTTRADFGLPEQGFVFCCFNNNYKIGPREFDIWMRLLGQVEGSVLWLLRSNRWAEANLRKEAGKRGIDPDRLRFADRVRHAEHLARHEHADLFVDTFNYNAHTTASDALWAGLPVVTKAGRQFSARVAASLLTAVGLPELVTHDEQDYEALILDLAMSPDRLAAVRAKLAANRLTQPLFDTVRYTRDFERALETALRAENEGGG